MRKSLVGLALLVGAATMLTTLAFAQDQDLGPMLKTPSMMKQLKVTKAARLGTSAVNVFPPGPSDTAFVGHVSGGGGSLPWHIGVGEHRPGLNYNGMWDFDLLTNGAGTDSAQGWVPFSRPAAQSPRHHEPGRHGSSGSVSGLG